MSQLEESVLCDGDRISARSILSVDSYLDSIFLLEETSRDAEQIASKRKTVSVSDGKIQSQEQKSLTELCINAIRFLCVDAINNANSGHPGICMGMAAAAFVLFDRHLKFCPSNPSWLNRDRFVLSAGHGSMLLYSLLHLYGYDSVTMDDIKNFRKLNSRTPGHPECTETAGVEVCTGPLGQGLSNAVGMAISEAHLASVYNRPGFQVIDNFTYCIAGDGCMMEGITSEACSLAGHLKLGKLVVLYDDNNISIDGSTDLAFTEDVSRRFQSYGWQVLHVKNGNTDICGIDQALRVAKGCTDKPSLIKLSTTIGYGAPTKGNTASIHGSALGPEETQATRKILKYAFEPFKIPAPAMEHFRSGLEDRKAKEASWLACIDQYRVRHPDLAAAFDRDVFLGKVSSEVENAIKSASLANQSKSMATRKHSKVMLNTIAPVLPSLIGGSADTSPSTLTDLSCSQDFTSSSRDGRNIRFGVREHAMGAIANGVYLAGYNLRPFCSTFLVFSDYMRAAMRMASLSKAGTIFVMTHDSIALGEDGPSHQPTEHLASLRAMPNHDVWRPADAVETGASYSKAIESRNTPSTLVFTRQSTEALACTDYEGAKRGGYIVQWSNEPVGTVDGAIIATGSELSIAVEAAKRLLDEKNLTAQVVSLPCWEEFRRQNAGYRKSVLNVDRERTISIEAASSFGWDRFADHHISVEDFGKSGNGKEVCNAFGINLEAVVGLFINMVTKS